MEFHHNILIVLIVSLVTIEGAEDEAITKKSDNDTQVSIDKNSQLDKLFFQQEIPNEFKSIIPSLIRELDNLTDAEFLHFLKKASERAKQSYEELKSIHDQLEKNLTSIPVSQRLKRCHSCHKKRTKFISPMPVIVPVAVPMYYQKGGGGCGGYGGCGGGQNYGYQQPQRCYSCGGGGHGGGGYGGGGHGGGGYGGGGSNSGSYASATASATSGSWGKK